VIFSEIRLETSGQFTKAHIAVNEWFAYKF